MPHLQTQPLLLVNISIFSNPSSQTAAQISWSLRFPIFFSQRQSFRGGEANFLGTVAISLQLTNALEYGKCGIK